MNRFVYLSLFLSIIGSSLLYSENSQVSSTSSANFSPTNQPELLLVKKKKRKELLPEDKETKERLLRENEEQIAMAKQEMEEELGRKLTYEEEDHLQDNVLRRECGYE